MVSADIQLLALMIMTLRSPSILFYDSSSPVRATEAIQPGVKVGCDHLSASLIIAVCNIQQKPDTITNSRYIIPACVSGG